MIAEIIGALMIAFVFIGMFHFILKMGESFKTAAIICTFMIGLTVWILMAIYLLTGDDDLLARADNMTLSKECKIENKVYDSFEALIADTLLICADKLEDQP